MSKATSSSKAPRLQKVSTLWTHPESFSREDVLFNADHFSELGLHAGSLVQIIALKQSTANRDFEGAASGKAQGNSGVVTLDENGTPIKGGRDVHKHISFLFVVKPMSPEIRKKRPDLQISISEAIAKHHSFRNRSQIAVSAADEDAHSASHVEITFRDAYLARGDMWQLTNSELSKKTVYKGQKILFMGSIRVTITNIFVNGRIRQSAYFSPKTKPIFRSESSRYAIFIQMSKEMWDFDAKGSGETLFNKVTDEFLPEMFARWQRIQARHLITIILFTRIEYEQDFAQMYGTQRSLNSTDGKASQDFFRTVVSEMPSEDWIKILQQLKKEYKTFLKDVSLIPQHHLDATMGTANDGPEFMIAGTPSSAPEGNILEGINLGALQFSKDYIDRDLVRTGKSVIVISPGTGVFQVDFNRLKLTTDTIMGTGIGIDLVCLSPMPLHSVPLFVYKSPRLVSDTSTPRNRAPKRGEGTEDRSNTDFEENTPRQSQAIFGPFSRRGTERSLVSTHNNSPEPGSTDGADEWTYGMPHWLDISYWPDTSRSANESKDKTDRGWSNSKSSFMLRCHMYELQMMGVMENELSNISIPYVHEDPLYQLNFPNLTVPASLGSSTPHISKTNTPVGSLPRGHSPNEAEKHQHRIMRSSWMKAHDENIFHPVGTWKEAEAKHVRFAERMERERAQSQVTLRGSLLSASLNVNEQSLGSSARPPSGMNFHQLMRERSKDNQFENEDPSDETGLTPRRESALQLRGRTVQDIHLHSDRSRQHNSLAQSTTGIDVDQSSSVSPTKVRDGPKHMPALSSIQKQRPRGSISNVLEDEARPTSRSSSKKEVAPARPSGWLSRHISFSALGFGASKAIPVTAVSTGSAEATHITREGSQSSVLTLKQKDDDAEHNPEKHSQPISIRSASRGSVSSKNSPSTEEVARSVDTVKHVTISRLPENQGSLSALKDPNSIFLSKGLLNQASAKLNLSSSGGAEEIPRTLSPTKAVAPWVVLLNPCNSKRNKTSAPSQFRRWQHVFPRPLRVSSIKWKSLSSPASVPLTNEYFPTAKQLTAEYHESPYKIILNEDDESLAAAMSPNALIRELIAFRLSHGFQIVVGPNAAEVSGAHESEIANIFDENFMCHSGDSIYMSVGNTIHQLVRMAAGEVEVKRYNRKPTTALETSAGVDSPLLYKPLIRTAVEKEYKPRHIVLRPPREEYNWNVIDNFLAGHHDEFSETLRFWRARFVLIPVELPSLGRRPFVHSGEDTDEEIRLEGIRKLTQVWQRHRFTPLDEQHFQASLSGRKDPNPLAIEYQTMDPSAIVAAGIDNSLLADKDPSTLSSQIFATSEPYHSRNIDLHKLAKDLQGEHGIPIVDRWWHLKLYYNCFLGADLTTWLLQNFVDVDTRENAVKLGNELMKNGLFQHVGRHQFRDGNFFYTFRNEYRAPRASGWFGRRSDKSVPSTPMSDGPKSSPILPRPRSRANTEDSPGGSEELTPTRVDAPKRKVTLSSVLRYDVDHRKRSYRPEIINLHYDRLHNPDNCYHIRIDWMNVTAKLIEDAIGEWTKSVEKYGLKLVELPIAEAAEISNRQPFRSPYRIKLAEPPPQTLPVVGIDANRLGSQPQSDKFGYHKAVLKHMGFVLDMESASSFPPDVDVTYSWGKPDYQYTQYIHKSGVVLTQITTEGDFLVLANRLCDNRAGTARDANKFERAESHYDLLRGGRSLSGRQGNPSIWNGRSPFSSPLSRPVDDSLLGEVPPMPALVAKQSKACQSAEQIKEDLEAFCADKEGLKKFYDLTLKLSAAPSPRLMPIPDSPLPSMSLGPGISLREASPAPTLGQSFLSRHPSNYSGSSAQ